MDASSAIVVAIEGKDVGETVVIDIRRTELRAIKVELSFSRVIVS